MEEDPIERWYSLFDKIDRVVKGFGIALCIFACGYLAGHILYLIAFSR